MKVVENISIRSKNKKDIVADLYLATDGPGPVIIICHGFMGSKDWGERNLVAKALSENGYHVLKFNFSYSGFTKEDKIHVTDLETFSENNFSLELDDLYRVVEWIETIDEYSSNFNTDEIYLIGADRGGALGIIFAASDDRIKKIVTWSTIGVLERIFPSGAKLEQWKTDDVYYVFDKGLNKKLPLKYQFYEDYKSNRTLFNVPEAEKRLKIPHLLIHGTRDETARLGEALYLMSLNEYASLIKIQDATHSFGTYNPSENKSLPSFVEMAVNYTLTFFQNE